MKHQEINKGKLKRETLFHSVNEQVDFALNGALASSENEERFEEIRAEGGGEFENGWNAIDFPYALQNPPRCGAEVQELAEILEEEHVRKDMKRKRRTGQEDGEELDPIEVKQGNPEAWTDIKKLEDDNAQDIVHIGVNMGVNCTQSPEELRYRGAAAVALADSLEMAGYSVEMTAFSTIARLTEKDTEEEISVTKTTIKHPEEMLDPNAVALIVSNVGWHRRINFYTFLKANNYRCTMSLGRGTTMPTEIRERYDFDIIFDHDITSYEDAKEAVEQYAKEFSA